MTAAVALPDAGGQLRSSRGHVLVDDVGEHRRPSLGKCRRTALLSPRAGARRRAERRARGVCVRAHNPAPISPFAARRRIARCARERMQSSATPMEVSASVERSPPGFGKLLHGLMALRPCRRVKSETTEF